MHALAGERVEVRGHRCHERLTFTGLHLSDRAHVERCTTDYLDVVGPLPNRSHRCFTHDCECFGKETVERGTFCEASLEFLSFRCQLGIGKCLHIGFKPVDLGSETFQAPKGFAFTNAHDPVENRHGLSSPLIAIA